MYCSDGTEIDEDEMLHNMDFKSETFTIGECANCYGEYYMSLCFM